MTDIVRDPYGNPLNRDNLITALRAENEKMRAALDMIDSISVHSGGDIHGVPPSLWEGAFKGAQAIARAALEEKP